MRDAFVRRLLTGLIVFATILVSAAAPVGAKQSDTIRMGYSNITAAELPAWYALDKGLFAKHGLNVDEQLLSGGANTVAGLLSGQVHFAHAGGSEVMSAVSSGADLVILAVTSPVYPYILEVSPEINTVNDLVGKKVGVATFGGSADVATRVVLRQYGLNPDEDVALVATGSAANRTAALLSGAIQGGMAGGPPDTLELEARGLHPLFDLAALKLPAANTTVIAQRSWVKANPDLVQRYIDTLVESTAQVKQDKEGSVALLKTYYKTDDDATMSAAYDFHVQEVLASLPYPKPELFGDSIQQLGATNPRIREVDLSNVLDPSYVQSAADRGLGV